MFLHEFDKFVCDVSSLPGKLILLSDFHVHKDRPTKSDVLQFSSSTSSAGLTQYVYGPTHKDGHTLDLVFTRCDDTFLHDCYTEDKLMSDHRIICFTLDIPKPTPQRVNSTLRDYQKINHDDFSKFISEFTSNFLSNANADYDTCSNSLFECYHTGLKIILDLHAPSTTRTRTIKSRMPWYNDTIHMARRNRRQAERKWRKTRSVDDRELYLAAERNVRDLTISAKEAYFKDKLSSCNSKDVYRIIGTFLNKNVQHQ